MSEKIEIVQNNLINRKKADLKFFSEEVAKKAHKFHLSFEQYTETPLVELKELAKYLGIKSIFIKDESYRFGLNAFKVLGGSFSIGKIIAKKLGKDVDDLPYEAMISEEIRKQLGDLTFTSVW